MRCSLLLFRIKTIHIVLAMDIVLDLELKKLDIKTIFWTVTLMMRFITLNVKVFVEENKENLFVD